MEIIGVILMIIFALVSASDKKKKAAKRAEQQRANVNEAMRAAGAIPKEKPAGQMGMAERQARLDELKRKKAERAAQKAAVPVMPSNAEESFASSLTELKQLLNVAGQAAPAEGESMMADAECAGGSMPHRHTQGVSRAAQNRRLDELDHRREAEDEDRLVPAAIDARALRRAVVMAEVLGKPRAMRRG